MGEVYGNGQIQQVCGEAAILDKKMVRLSSTESNISRQLYEWAFEGTCITLLHSDAVTPFLITRLYSLILLFQIPNITLSLL